MDYTPSFPKTVQMPEILKYKTAICLVLPHPTADNDRHAVPQTYKTDNADRLKDIHLRFLSQFPLKKGVESVAVRG